MDNQQHVQHTSVATFGEILIRAENEADESDTQDISYRLNAYCVCYSDFLN